MKKTIAILLLLCTLMGLLAACEKNEEEPRESETIDKEITDNLPAVDMRDFELNMFVNDSDDLNWAEITIVPEGDFSGQMLYEEMFERNAFIEERFNCIFSVTIRPMMTAEYVRTLALSDDASSSPEILMLHDRNVMSSAAYFRDWSECTYMDLSQEYWNPGVSDLFNINGKQIALSGSFSLGMLSRTLIFTFNKEMYEQYYGDVAGMYSTVTENEWTWEKIYQLGQNVLSSADDTWNDDDQYGITGAKKEIYTSLMVGGGIKFIQKDDTGTPKFTLPSDTYAIDKMQKLLYLNQDNNIYYDSSPSISSNKPVNIFESGRSLFAIQSLFNIPKIRATMQQEFGILPIPKYDSEQKEFYSICHGGDMACLLKTVKEENLEYIGIIMEALSFDSQQNLLPIYKDVLLKTRYASDPDSSAMLDIVFTSMVSDFGINALEDKVTYPLISQIFAPKRDQIGSFLTSMSTVHRELADIVAAIR